jgi:hypothetical protein
MAEYVLPEPVRNQRGEVRRVGVELEFGGVSLPEAAEAVRAAFGGELRQDHEHRFTVATALGEFEVTYDSTLLSDKRYAELLDRLPINVGDGVKSAVEGVLKRIGNAILPLEVSSPPIPVTRLGELNRLEDALRARHAEGTRAGLFYAFALHFNPEAPDPHDPAGIARTLRAFLLLYEWLFRRADVDYLRRLLPFIDPFPSEYARLVIDPDYAPDLGRLVDDYVRYSPTRNRPLDQLPILAFNDRELMNRPELKGQKVTPRPTYHYRLPNSLIDDPSWSIAHEWGQWVLVERLANHPEMLRGLADAYLNWDGSLLDYLNDRWVRYVEDEWVTRLRGQPAAVDPVPG